MSELKMKPVKAWAIVAPWNSAELMHHFPSQQPIIFKTRADAETYVYNHQDGRKFVRVEIREVKRKVNP